MSTIQYLDLVHGKRHFACARLHATLSTTDCAARFQNSRNPNKCDDFSTCRGCPIGGLHYDTHATSSTTTIGVLPKWTPDSGQTCVRCGTGSTRVLPSSSLCVSCHNRWLEYRKGRNARGTACATYIPPKPRRVGIIKDGKPAWYISSAQNTTEPLARTRRRGHEMHTEHPAPTNWNSERQEFEYRDRQGRVLVDLLVDDELHFVAVDQLRPGEVPAPVREPVDEMSATELALWLTLTSEDGPLIEEWRAQPVLCESCHHAPLQARRRAGRVECRCQACEVTSS